MKRKITEDFIKEIYSLPPKKNCETNKTTIKSINDTWSADSLDMHDYGPENNKGYRYILVVIDNFSRYAGTLPLKNKYAKKYQTMAQKI